SIISVSRSYTKCNNHVYEAEAPRKVLEVGHAQPLYNHQTLQSMKIMIWLTEEDRWLLVEMEAEIFRAHMGELGALYGDPHPLRE
ncbi:unnamed protein product, partial [marine sediment metagenome]